MRPFEIAHTPTQNSHSAGGVVLGDGGTIALVRTIHGKGWTFPKGHVEPGEEDEAAARREIHEECGIATLELIADLGSYERFRIAKDGVADDESESKTIHLYLFAAPAHQDLQPTMEIAEAIWVPYREVATRLTHAKDQAWFATVFPRIRQAVERD